MEHCFCYQAQTSAKPTHAVLSWLTNNTEKKLPSLKKTGLASLHQPVLLGTAKSDLPVSEVYKQLLQAYFREHQKFKIPRPLRSLAQNDINREGQKYQQAVPS